MADDSARKALKDKVVVKHQVIGVAGTDQRWQKRTNFSVKIVSSVQTDEDPAVAPFRGFEFLIRTDNGIKRNCVISNEDALSLSRFCKAASAVHPDIRRSKISDQLWSQFIFDMAEEFCSLQEGFRKKKNVTCIGRQPGSTTWVFNPDTQIDTNGTLIEKDQQCYIWVPGYKPLPDIDQYLIPAEIELPLSLRPFKYLLRASKECLQNNFLSCFATIAGKTTALRIALSIYGGLNRNINSHKTSSSSLLIQTALGTTPIGLDDVQSKLKIEEISVELFNGFSKRTLGSGSVKPKTSIIVTSNEAFYNSERNTQRIIHVPFFPPDNDLTKSEKHELEVKLRDVLNNASSCIGEFIALGQKSMSENATKELEEQIIPFVSSQLHGLSYRVVKGYAMIVMMMKLLCRMSGKVVEYKEVESFFKEKWAPIIVKLHQPGGENFYSILSEVTSGMESMTTEKIQQILRTDVITTKVTGNCAAIHMASARKMIVGLTDRQINDAIIQAGGLINFQVKYLGKASKSFLIPHTSIRTDILSRWSQLYLGTTTDDDQQLPELENDALGSTNENGSESNCQPTRTLSNADTEDESEFSSSTNFDNVSLSASIEDTQEQPNDDNSLFQEGQSTASPSEKCIFSDSDDCDKETHGTAPPSESSIFSDNDDYDKILYEKFVKKCQRSYKLKTFVKPHYKGTLRKRVINSPRNRTIIRKERVPLVSAKQSSKSLIKPTLVPDTCGATTCIISNSTAKKIDWVKCQKCKKWIHLFCINLMVKNLPKVFFCNNCNE